MSALTILHSCRTIQLTRGFNTLVDEADFEQVNRYRWNAWAYHRLRYARRLERVGAGKGRERKYRAMFVHRLILDAPADKDVDHCNSDGLDNRKANLRLVTPSQNSQNNRKFQGASKFKGVHRCRNRWVSYICISGKMKYVGCFHAEQEVARAYDAAARKHFGEFARTNSDIFGDY
jgi:hypothetical protein